VKEYYVNHISYIKSIFGKANIVEFTELTAGFISELEADGWNHRYKVVHNTKSVGTDTDHCRQAACLSALHYFYKFHNISKLNTTQQHLKV